MYASSLVCGHHSPAIFKIKLISTSKRKKQPKRPEVRSLKVQPKYRFNKWSNRVVPALILGGKWWEASGFKKKAVW